MLLEQIKNYEIFRPKCDYSKEPLLRIPPILRTIPGNLQQIFTASALQAARHFY
jgi:hypothetical protein